MTTRNEGRSEGVLSLEPAAPSGSETARLVESRLRESPYASLQDIACDESGGVLRLRGRLPSQYLKQVALQAASALAAGRRIMIEIQVVSPSRPAPAEPLELPTPGWGWKTLARD